MTDPSIIENKLDLCIWVSTFSFYSILDVFIAES